MTAPRLVAFPLLLLAVAVRAESPSGYHPAPEAIRKILDLPAAPAPGLSPDGRWLVLAEQRVYPSIAEVSRPFLRLAGLRIDPATSGPHQSARITAVTLRPTNGGPVVTLELPSGVQMGMPLWAPDARRFVLTGSTEKGIGLWLGEPGSTRLRRIPGVQLVDVLGDAVQWLPDGRTLLCQTVPAGRGAPPTAPTTPGGPVIQQTSGKAAPVRTFQDLLKNPHDEALFDHHATVQLALVHATAGKQTPIGKPGVVLEADPSPDGKHLLVAMLHRPYSYLMPAGAFPRTVEVWDLFGKRLHRLADLPLADRVPIQGVPTGPRSYHWQPDRPATLVWAEALDGGDPARKAEFRDEVFRLDAPFTGKPVRLIRLGQRFMGLGWTEKGLALVSDYDRDRRRRRTFLLDAARSDAEPRLLWDLSIHDRYGDPGSPVLRRLPSGRRAIRQQGDAIFLIGAGSSPEGDRPFLDRFDLASGKATRLFHCAADCYEAPLAVLGKDAGQVLTRHESPSDPPNYRVRAVGGDTVKALTDIPDRAPQLRKIQRRLVTYKRADGVPLSFTLYLPPDYKPGTRLPTVVWAYPREYNDPKLAGQVIGSTRRYTTINGPSHLFFLLAGYAVLDGATMPVVGTPEKANDTFVEQIVASARAAIDKAVELGVTDRNRVGVGGHSYGAFMTANLLAHSDLFRAGIARSGAYNRTLTPFGFQNERRTLWEAPEVYFRMSPFMHAQRIKAPILLIHGAADNNSGTFPLQSERMYQAIRGNGGTARYVVLPHESHGYRARESVEHCLYEMIAWFDEHVKKAPSR